VPNENRLKFDNKVVKFIFISYGASVNGYNLWDPIIRKVLYSRNFIFKEVKYSPIVVLMEEDKKKSKFQLPTKTKKVELENEQEVHDGPDEEEGLESLEEEEETPPQTLRRSTRQRR